MLWELGVTGGRLLGHAMRPSPRGDLHPPRRRAPPARRRSARRPPRRVRRVPEPRPRLGGPASEPADPPGRARPRPDRRHHGRHRRPPAGPGPTRRTAPGRVGALRPLHRGVHPAGAGPAAAAARHRRGQRPPHHPRARGLRPRSGRRDAGGRLAAPPGRRPAPHGGRPGRRAHRQTIRAPETSSHTDETGWPAGTSAPPSTRFPSVEPQLEAGFRLAFRIE
jgi:hypothetical protein